MTGLRRLLLRLYPPAWRRRYGDELMELLDETGVGPRETLDVARGAARERAAAARSLMADGGLQMVIGPAWRHPTAWAAVGALLVVPSLVVLGWGALFNVAASNGVLDAYRVLDLALVLAPFAALVAALAPLLRLELRRGGGGKEEVVGLRVRALNLVVGTLALALALFLVGHIVVESVLRIGA